MALFKFTVIIFEVLLAAAEHLITQAFLRFFL